MRVYGPNGTALATSPTTARRASGGAFTVTEDASPRSSNAAGSLRAISTIDALIALQGVEDPTQRRKRAVAKGRTALDVLDALKLGLLDGGVDQSMLSRLKVASEGLTDASGEAGLDVVLGEIDLRVAVELAKAGVR
jgi:hypothetical protein